MHRQLNAVKLQAQATNSSWGNAYSYNGFGNLTGKTAGSAPSLSMRTPTGRPARATTRLETRWDRAGTRTTMSSVTPHTAVSRLTPRIAVILACLVALANAQLIPQGSKLLGTGAIGAASQGRSVALSSDGNTAIIGGDSDNNFTGAAWVFTRSNGAWTQQQKLTTIDVVSQFGLSVAISGDGNTALVGSNSQVNAVWVFTRTNGVWSPPQKLSPTGAVHFAQIGYSVALSADGNTALIGAPGDADGVGAAWVFTRMNGLWTQQGNKLIGAGATGLASHGYAVALSADGNTAVVGGPADNFIGGTSIGAAWVFSRSNGLWDEGRKLAGNTTDGLRQGSAVAISGDGNTVLVSGPYGVGGAWVFVRTGGAWTQQAGPLAGPTAGKFSGDGTSVALNADGNVAIIGGPGDNDAWLFTRANGTWTQRQEVTVPDVASPFSQLGYSAAISADTTTFLLGAPGDNPQNVRNVGATWAFYAPPASIAATAGIPQSTFVASAFATRLQTMVTNTLGYPSPGVTVTFTAPTSGPTGTFQGGSNVAATVTNFVGIATAPPFTANRLPGGPYTVTASVAGLATGVNFVLTNIPLAVNITLQTSPPNLLVSFDGGKFSAAPLTQQLVPGSSHTIATQSAQTSASGNQYSFMIWSDGQPLSHTITVPITDTTYTAIFAPTPAIGAGGVVNAASNAPLGMTGGIAQGSFMTIYGANIGPATGVSATSLPLSSSLGGVSVSVTPANGGPGLIAYPTYVSAGQINAILPSKTPVGLENLTVTFNGVTSQPVPIQVVNASFGIFTANFGSGPAAIIDASTNDPILSATNAARPGDFLELFGTGLGPVNVPDNDAPGGAISPSGITVQVLVGGQTITPIYAGRSPQFPGEDQINFQLPPAGLVAEGCSVSVSVVVNGVRSNTATLPIASSGGACLLAA